MEAVVIGFRLEKKDIKKKEGPNEITCLKELRYLFFCEAEEFFNIYESYIFTQEKKNQVSLSFVHLHVSQKSNCKPINHFNQGDKTDTQAQSHQTSNLRNKANWGHSKLS